MAVVWLILKGIGWILLVLLALLVIALLVPVTAELCYEQGSFTAALRVLLVRVRLYPRPEKKKQALKKPKKKAKTVKLVQSKTEPPKPTAQPEKAAEPAVRQPQPEQKSAQPPKPQADGSKKQAQKKAAAKSAPEKTLRQTLDWVLHWARTGGEILRRLLAGFKIHHIRICLPVQRDTAAATAIAVGAVHAGLGASFGALQNFFDLRMEQLVIEPDYTGEHQGQEHFSCKITSHLIIMVITGVWALMRLKQEKLI